MLKDIVDVRPMGGYRVHLRFEDGLEGDLDLGGMIEFRGIFAPLRDGTEFAKVQSCANLARMVESLEAGFLLDRRWHWLRGEMERSKEPDLAAVVAVLSSRGVSYAVIGGVALQIHQKDPRTTIDIDVAVPDRAGLPRGDLVGAGFKETGRHQHSDNWIGPEGTPIQFTDDPALRDAISRALEIQVGATSLRVLRADDLIHEKLRSGHDPARRRSKRLQDLADVQALLEQDPSLARTLTAEEKALLDRLPE